MGQPHYQTNLVEVEVTFAFKDCFSENDSPGCIADKVLRELLAIAAETEKGRAVLAQAGVTEFCTWLGDWTQVG